MNPCAWLLAMVMCQTACVSKSAREPAAVHRAVASDDEASRFDGTYQLVARRCGIDGDFTQVKGDVLALNQTYRAHHTTEIETGHSHLSMPAVPSFRLTIAGRKFTYAARVRCGFSASSEVPDAAAPDSIGTETCGADGKTVVVDPDRNPSRLDAVNEYLVESLPSRCPDGRTQQAIWMPLPSL